MRTTFPRSLPLRMATMTLVFLTGCASDGYGGLQERFDAKSGKMVQEYVLPCYVSRTYTPWGAPIKKEGPQRNLIRFVDGGASPMEDADACFVVTDDGMLKRTSGSCPPLKVVSPEMCEDK
jgi:hypothetical protein